MYANLFFDSENKVDFFFSPLIIVQLVGVKMKPFITAPRVPGRVRNTLQDASCWRLKERAPEAEEV